uniref:Ovule protein n=1 Tax=Ascaris lumbricoides TaxID=6252 RepID=A0A0M3INX0_ASCLU
LHVSFANVHKNSSSILNRTSLNEPTSTTFFIAPSASLVIFSLKWSLRFSLPFHIPPSIVSLGSGCMTALYPLCSRSRNPEVGGSKLSS